MSIWVFTDHDGFPAFHGKLQRAAKGKRPAFRIDRRPGVLQVLISGETVDVMDAHSSEAYQWEHIPGAISIPQDEMSSEFTKHEGKIINITKNFDNQDAIFII